MTLLDAAFAAAAVALLAVIAAADCRRFRMPLSAVALLAATGIAWHATTPSAFGLVSSAWWMPLLGLACGTAIPAAAMAAAAVARRRWPFMPGDAFLLGGIGAVAGPLGLAVIIAAGSACSLLYRAHLQRVRGRPFTRGYVPLAPGMALAAAAVILAMPVTTGLADGHGGDESAAQIAGVVLGPETDPGPPGSADHMMALVATAPLTIAEAAARLAAATHIPVIVEERPSRTGVTETLPEPAPQRFDLEGSLVDILDSLAALYRHRWEWRAVTIVFYRYWDLEFAGTTAPRPQPRQTRWIVDTDVEATLAETLDRWATEADWSLVWSAHHDYSLGADAVFEGSFLGAVDALLADPVTQATLTAVAYPANRRLVIEEAR